MEDHKIKTGDKNVEVCPRCLDGVDAAWRYCGHCGARLLVHTCSNCQKPIPPELNHCTTCGRNAASSHEPR